MDYTWPSTRGMTLVSDGGRFIIKVAAGSEAASAGIRDGDDIVLVVSVPSFFPLLLLLPCVCCRVVHWSCAAARVLKACVVGVPRPRDYLCIGEELWAAEWRAAKPP
jgi:hypothetical protein